MNRRSWLPHCLAAFAMGFGVFVPQQQSDGLNLKSLLFLETLEEVGSPVFFSGKGGDCGDINL